MAWLGTGTLTVRGALQLARTGNGCGCGPADGSRQDNAKNRGSEAVRAYPRPNPNPSTRTRERRDDARFLLSGIALALQSPGLRIIPCPSGLGSIPQPCYAKLFFAPLVAKSRTTHIIPIDILSFAFVTFRVGAPGVCLPVRQQTYLLKYRSGYASVPAPVSSTKLIRKTNNQYQRQWRQPRRHIRTREQDKITRWRCAGGCSPAPSRPVMGYLHLRATCSIAACAG